MADVQRYRVCYCPNTGPKLGAKTHASIGTRSTLCGKTITDRWWIMDNRGVLPVTCPVCLRKEADCG